MRKNFIKIPVLTLGLFLSLPVLNSCVKEDEISITPPSRYTYSDIKSYADLFKTFWSVMDQNYNYFYEQKRRDGKDWNAIYREYYPKFAALKTFGRPTENDRDIADDQRKAAEYFIDIIDPIIDRHFRVDIKMPATNNNIITTFQLRGGMKSEINNSYEFGPKYAYMKSKLSQDAIIASPTYQPPGDKTYSLQYMVGKLRSNPDIFYLTFDQFSVATLLEISLKDKYLSPDPGNKTLLTEEMIDSSEELNAIKNVEARKQIRDFTVNILNEWNSFAKSAPVKTFHDEIATFKSTDIVSDAFVNASREILTNLTYLVPYSKSTTYSSVLTNANTSYVVWFIGKMKNHESLAYKFTDIKDAAQRIVDRAPFYQKFLNPLHRGEVKKLIIDVRNNGGGDVIDSRFLIDRFITKPAIWSYQRTKEGNGQFNYTPWIPVQIKPHKFGIPANIPIAILTDKTSISMSEMSTLMLKSQGAQVVSIGDFSNGATAGLTSNSDTFNGGIQFEVAGRLKFYMPVMATKDANGQVIEGIGIKPEIYVTPPTGEELRTMKNSPETFVDRVMAEAIKYLSN